MTSIKRLTLPLDPDWGESNIRQQYEIQGAEWVWHPDCSSDDVSMLEFELNFEVDDSQRLCFHVSADERYELYFDETLVSRGPDRCDVLNWSFASYELKLEKGTHCFKAKAWSLKDIAPNAQVSYKPGFLFKADGQLADILDTGKGNWQVRRIQGIEYLPSLGGSYHVIGPGYHFTSAYFCEQEALKPVRTVHRAIPGSGCGESVTGWQLKPSYLPEQIYEEKFGGCLRAIIDGDPEQPLTREHTENKEIFSIQDTLLAGETLSVAAGSTRHLVWDLEEYYCGYALLAFSKGKGAQVEIKWAESLFDKDRKEKFFHKGNRDEVFDKVFFGFGDRIDPDGGDKRLVRIPWWRSGRYLLISITTGAEALDIDRLAIAETRYPFKNTSAFKCSDEELNGVIPLTVRGMQMCSHETYMDCPYYEQMMYVGDTRVEMLVAHVMNADTRLVKRGIELFDQSRWFTGFVAERYPSSPRQLSLTFSMIWVLMLRDYAWWQNEPNFIRERIKGMRCLFENFFALPWREDGLIGHLPGWSFIDWVYEDGWHNGRPPGWDENDSAIINLLFIHALNSAAEVEEHLGEKLMAERYRQKSQAMSEKVVENYWVESRGLIADHGKFTHFSEHAQCLALLAGILSPDKEERCFETLISATDLAKTTVYFSFYLHETYKKFERGELMLAHFELWKGMVKNGFKTPIEKTPEPSRSDCHAWGSHPFFHFNASLAGIRPDSPGFSKVRIEPCPGTLENISSQIPHPKGKISADLSFKDGRCQAKVSLPSFTTGTFVWKGQTHELVSGVQSFAI